MTPSDAQDVENCFAFWLLYWAIGWLSTQDGKSWPQELHLLSIQASKEIEPALSFGPVSPRMGPAMPEGIYMVFLSSLYQGSPEKQKQQEVCLGIIFLSNWHAIMKVGKSDSIEQTSNLYTQEEPILQFMSKGCMLAEFPVAQGRSIFCSIQVFS